MLTPLLFIFTWISWVTVCFGLGLILTHFLENRGPLGLRLRLQSSLWLGMITFVIVLLILNFFVGLSTGVPSTLSMLAIFIGYVLTGLWIYRNRKILDLRAKLRSLVQLRRIPTLFFLALLILGIWLSARFAGGEPMDGDAGLYRLGAINYAGNFPTIPGLANLQDRFGFNSSLWSTTSFMGNNIWEHQGFRLITGFFIVALIAEIFLRIAVPRKFGATAGDWLIVISTTFIGAMTLTDSGRWITSPAQDTIFAIVLIVAFSYFADFMTQINRRKPLLVLGVAIALAALAGSVRPLGWLLAPCFALVGVLYLINRKDSSESSKFAALVKQPGLMLGVLLAAVLFFVMLIRDVLLSGWLLYPLSYVKVPVEWAAIDPTQTRRWITAFGRMPFTPLEEVMGSNTWIGPWIESTKNSREFYLLSLILLGFLASFVFRRTRRVFRENLSTLLLLLIPSSLLVLTWFVSAPDLRFGWGALVAFVALPLSVLLAKNAYPPRTVRILGVTLLILMMAANIGNGRTTPRGREPIPVPVSLGFANLTLHLAPENKPELGSAKLADGTATTFPSTSGECWQVFPLCLLRGTADFVTMRGNSISDGFLSFKKP